MKVHTILWLFFGVFYRFSFLCDCGDQNSCKYTFLFQVWTTKLCLFSCVFDDWKCSWNYMAHFWMSFVSMCVCVYVCVLCAWVVCVCVICVECSLGGLTWKFVISHCNENTKFEFTSAFSAHNEWICLGVWQQTFPKRGGKKAVNSKFLFSQQTTARKCTFLS